MGRGGAGMDNKLGKKCMVVRKADKERQIIDPTSAGRHRASGERQPDVRGAGGHRHEPAVGAEGAGGSLGDGGRSGSLLEGGLLRHRLRRLGHQQ